VNANTDGDYTIGEVREMWKTNPASLLPLIGLETNVTKEGIERYEKTGQALVERRTGVDQSVISTYLSYFKVSKELQKAL